MLKLLQNNHKVIIILTIVVLIISISLFSIYQNNVKEIENVTWEYWKKGDDRRGGSVIKRAIEVNKKRTYKLLSFNLSMPIAQTITVFETLSDGRTNIDFETFYLERTGINSFKVNESIISTSTAYTFEEAVGIAKKYDVYKNNPDKSKIRNSPESNLTPAEIEQTQKQEQKNNEILNQYEQKVQENKDKGLLNFQTYLAECVMRTSPGLKGDLPREIYDQCKLEYDKYLLEKGVTWDSLNP